MYGGAQKGGGSAEYPRGRFRHAGDFGDGQAH